MDATFLFLKYEDDDDDGDDDLRMVSWFRAPLSTGEGRNSDNKRRRLKYHGTHATKCRLAAIQ